METYEEYKKRHETCNPRTCKETWLLDKHYFQNDGELSQCIYCGLTAEPQEIRDVFNPDLPDQFPPCVEETI
jgi:hypothetical protein